MQSIAYYISNVTIPTIPPNQGGYTRVERSLQSERHIGSPCWGVMTASSITITDELEQEGGRRQDINGCVLFDITDPVFFCRAHY